MQNFRIFSLLRPMVSESIWVLVYMGFINWLVINEIVRVSLTHLQSVLVVNWYFHLTALLISSTKA